MGPVQATPGLLPFVSASQARRPHGPHVVKSSRDRFAILPAKCTDRVVVRARLGGGHRSEPRGCAG